MQADHLSAVEARPGDEIVPDLPRTENKKYYPALDGLRAIAVLLVFFQHYEASAHPSLNWGWTGVDLFFVLSGFLITGILFDTRETAHRFRNFYVRRTLRIFPLYYGVLFVGLLLTPIYHFRWHPAWLLWVTYLGNYVRFLFLHDPLFHLGALEHLRAMPPYPYPKFFYLGHFWSLCVEEQFYLVWPLVVYTVRGRERLRNLSILVCILTLAARIACLFVVPGEYLSAELLYRATPLRADALLIGGLVALCLRGPEADRIRRWAGPVLLTLCGGFVVWECLYKLLSPKHMAFHPYGGDPVMTTVGYTLLDIFAAALIVKLIQPDTLLFRLFDRSTLRWLGQISYGFYVFHDIFHMSYHNLAARFVADGAPTKQRMLTNLFALVGTTVLAYLSFRFYEAPFLRLKERFTVSAPPVRSRRTAAPQ